MNFGNKMKTIRKINNFSQEQMADALFTTQGNYSQYENNNRIPSIDFIKRFIEKFNTDANWLLSDTDDRESYHVLINNPENTNPSAEVLNEIKTNIAIILQELNKSGRY